MRHAGPTSLATSELLSLALQLGTGGEKGIDLAEDMLIQCGGLIGLAQMNLFQLENDVRGIGVAKAAQLSAIFEICRRMSVAMMGERPVISSPADAAALLMPQMSLLQEERLTVMMLNVRSRVVGVYDVYQQGGTYTTAIRVAEVFREPIRRNSTAVIVAHNHPSGDPTPSPEDVSVTRQLVDAGRMLDIPVVDHLIIGLGRFVSLKERGLIVPLPERTDHE